MNDKGRWFKKITRTVWVLLLKLLRIIMLIGISVSTSAVMAEVIMRYVFKSSIIGIEELAAYFAFWVYFIGASYGSYERSHIKAELTHLIFKNPRHYAKSRAVTSIISFTLALYAIPWAYKYVEWGILRHEQSRSTLFGNTYPVVLFQASILFGLVLMCFYFLVEAVQWLQPLIKGTPIPKEMMTARKEIDSWI
jgi:TRAP-type C4-dicarboxylate transport system permease small subunit